jgi:hypothetical protein
MAGNQRNYGPKRILASASPLRDCRAVVGLLGRAMAGVVRGSRHGVSRKMG